MTTPIKKIAVTPRTSSAATPFVKTATTAKPQAPRPIATSAGSKTSTSKRAIKPSYR